MQFPEQFQEALRLEDVYGNSLQHWLLALGVLVLTWVLLRLTWAIIRRRAAALAERSAEDWPKLVVSVVAATRRWFLLIVAFYAGSQVLRLGRADAVLDRIAVVALLVQAALWGTRVLEFAVARSLERRAGVDPASLTALSLLEFIGKLAIWSVAVLLALENVGIDVTTLIAGLGIGGIAVALAAQSALGDLLASLGIILDKPFVLGDFIIVGETMGTVERVGLKTTRIRSLSGEQIIFPNSDLVKNRIRNFKRMEQRRIVFSFGVTYETPYEKLAAIPGMVREIIESRELTRFDRAHFQKYAEFALVFEVVYFVLSPDYIKYMDIQQAVNLEIYQRFEQAGIEFAYPTQTIYLSAASGESPRQ